MSALWSPYFLGLLGSIGVLVAVASLIWRHRHRSGGIELIALLLVILSWSVIYAVALLSFDPELHFWLERVMWLAIAVVPIAWLKFALVYTGHQYHIDRNVLGSLLLISVGIGAAAVTNPVHGLMWSSQELVEAGGVSVARQTSGLLHGPALVFIFSIILIGSLVVIRDPLGRKGLYHDQTAVLLIGTAAPVAAGTLSVVQISPIPGLDMTPYAFTISGLAFAYGVLRIDLFEFLPATQTIGRDLAIDNLSEGILIVDSGNRIVDANRAGAEIFDENVTDLRGANVRDLLFEDRTEEIDNLPSEVRVNGRYFGVTVSSIRDRTDVSIGHTVVLRDITDRRLRKTQLEVLNRVLRHNLRNKLAIVQGHVDLLIENHELDAESYHIITEAITDLIELSDRSREFERLKVLEGQSSSPVELSAMVSECIDDLQRAHSTAHFEVNIPEELQLTTYREVLSIAVENLLHNAVVHNDREEQHVGIVATETEAGLRLEIVDDGPGIPTDELSVLTEGRETAIQHGSGLGLWVTKWAVEYLRGDIVFEQMEPRGTRAILVIPSLQDDPDVAEQGASSTTSATHDYAREVKRISSTGRQVGSGQVR